MPNNPLEIVGDEFQYSIDHYEDFNVNLLFDRSIGGHPSSVVGQRSLIMLTSTVIRSTIWGKPEFYANML